MIAKFTDLIVEYPNALSDDLCSEIIEKFEQDPRKQEGQTGPNKISDLKKSTDLWISDFHDWREMDGRIYEEFSPYVKPYFDHLKETLGAIVQCTNTQVVDSGYQIQRTNVGQYYGWHTDDEYAACMDTLTHPIRGEMDSGSSGYQRRLFTYIFYLNDGFEGGRTQFRVGSGEEGCYSVTPEKGKLLCFPANFLFWHQGEPVTKGTKYLMTGWVSDYIMTTTVDTCPMSKEWRNKLLLAGRSLIMDDRGTVTGTL